MLSILQLVGSGIFLGVFYYCVYLLNQYLKFRDKINQFPGRECDSLFGDVLYLPRDRVKLFAYIRRSAKIFPDGFRMWGFLYGTLNFLKANDAEVILSSQRHLSKRHLYPFLKPWLGEGLLTNKGGKLWHQRRKLLTPAFHLNVLRRFVVIFGEHSEKFVEKLKQECTKDRTNILPLVSGLTLDLICETTMGVKLEDGNPEQKLYRDAIHNIGDIVVDRCLKPYAYFDFIYKFTPTGKIFFKHVGICHKFTRRIIREREKTFKESDLDNFDKEGATLNKKRFAMLDLLISAKRNSGIIDDEGIQQEVDTFMFEGHDTTSMAISFAIFCLAIYRDIQKEARNEVDKIFESSTRPADYIDLQNMNYLDLVIKEVLRLYPSVPFISRTIEDDDTIRDGKYDLPKNTMVNVHIYDLHRDPTVFEDPEKFDPNRFLPENVKHRNPYAYLPFSAGPRNCIGQRFAILEMKSVISSILRNFEILPIDTLENVEMMIDMVLRPSNGLYVKFQQRSSSTQF